MTDLEAQAWNAAFHRQLEELGWVDGRNIHIEYRWGAGGVPSVQLLAKELVGLNPDALVAVTTPATAALQAETHTIPIVFAVVSDPIGSGFVETLSKPGGNITGFINIEASLSGKWLELMREIAPSVSRVACLFNPQTAPVCSILFRYVPIRCIRARDRADRGAGTQRVRRLKLS